MGNWNTKVRARKLEGIMEEYGLEEKNGTSL